MFEITFSNQAEKFIKKCEKQTAQRILEKVKQLAIEPVPHNAVRVQGEPHTFRSRIGDFRIIYDIYWKEHLILIAKIGKRENIYD